MALITASIVITIFIVHVNSEQENISPKLGVKNLITKVVKEQSNKINELLNKIQTNAQKVLQKLRNLNQNPVLNGSPKKASMDRTGRGKSLGPQQLQIEAPSTASERSFTSHYSPSSYGVSTSYGTATYHHHSIGFDPFNIVLSMSLLSILFQALQGLLANTRLPTPVIEAKSLDPVESFVKKLRDKKKKDVERMYAKKYWKKHKNLID
ncbi:unnamed protein product [Leptosia nina]|uniref:Uncharacterized protein n=1 Tax=Leptosia nina TaxID=320188 RepID=A0AAV1K214_9NEOP